MEIVNSIKIFLRNLKWKLGIHQNFNNPHYSGIYGEWVGKNYLKKKGYRIHFKNWRSRRDRRNEIDLVCLDKKVLVFVEIRSRRENSLVTGYDSLNIRKRKALLKSFKAFLKEESMECSTYRFDLVEVDLPQKFVNKPKVFHHENIAIFNDSLH